MKKSVEEYVLEKVLITFFVFTRINILSCWSKMTPNQIDQHMQHFSNSIVRKMNAHIHTHKNHEM